MKELRDDTIYGSTIMIELDGKSAGVKYTAAQTLVIFPVNDEVLVQRLAISQGWELDKKFIIHYKVPIPYPFPSAMTIREALSRFCNLTCLLSYFNF